MATENKKNNTLAIVLGILLLLSFLGLGYLFVENSNLKDNVATVTKKANDTEIARQNVIQELNEMEAEYQTLSDQNQTMSEELNAEREKIKELIQQAKNKNWSISKLKKEAETLRNIMKGYLVTIDSLNTLNQELNTENIAVKGELETQKTVNQDLTSQNEGLTEKVNTAAQLQVVNFAVSGQIQKNSGAQKPTDKAGRTDVVKACFTIPSNAIAASGKRKIFMRIIGPFGSVLGAKEDPGFVVNGRKGVYTHHKEIEYSGASQQECMYWETTDELAKGNYNVQLYESGRELSQYTLSLK